MEHLSLCRAKDRAFAALDCSAPCFSERHSWCLRKRSGGLRFESGSLSREGPTRGSRPHPRRAARRAAGALGARAPRTTTERLRGGGRGAGGARGRARVQRDVACLLTTVARERARARGRGGEGSGLGRVLGAHAIRGSRERVRASKEASGSLARQRAARRR